MSSDGSNRLTPEQQANALIADEKLRQLADTQEVELIKDDARNAWLNSQSPWGGLSTFDWLWRLLARWYRKW